MSKNPVDHLAGFAVVTGASSGIGLELAKLAAKDRCELLLVADRELAEARSACLSAGAPLVETCRADLGTKHGIDELMRAIGTRPVDALFANAGQSKGGTFLEQDWEVIAATIDTNVKGTLSLLHQVGGAMYLRNRGRILVTGSIVDAIPGPFNPIYNASKAFIDNFVVAFADEMRDTDVVISCLLPGATDTEFFERAELEDTALGDAPKADPAKVAADGYHALLKGETQEVSGFLNKVQHMFADILPDELLARMHSKLAQPKSR